MSSNHPAPNKIYCGELSLVNHPNNDSIINLFYYKVNDMEPNVEIQFTKLIEDVTSLSPRIIDLLEIASYIYAADRKVSRGKRNSVKNDAWARIFEFNIPVRDIDFWNNEKIKEVLSSALTFMTGDRCYKFYFEKYKHDPVLSGRQFLLFSDEYVPFEESDNTEIVLFSGGLDSLAGVIEFLNSYPPKQVYLVSHNANTSTINTQKMLVSALQEKYGEKRIKHYKFKSHFMNYEKCIEETQRTRMFLYSAIAFSISHYYNKKEIYVFENGITSINLPKQADVFNARASRTTHPKTIGLLKKFYSFFNDKFVIQMPYMMKTKSDILRIFVDYNETNIIPSSVSCSRTRSKPTAYTHCGCCSQCIERRFAIYDENLEDIFDCYESDFITSIPNSEVKQRLYDILYFASMKGILTKEDFIEKYLNEITDIIDYWPGTNPDDKIDILYEFIRKNNTSILFAARKMQYKFDDLKQPIPKNSLIEMVNNREFLNSPFYVRVDEINKILLNAIPKMFQDQKPINESDLNDKIQALLSSHGKFSREYPELSFGITNYRADHSQDKLIIEAKYIRKGTTPSKATEGISADITKIQNFYGICFIVYDPYRAIIDDDLYVTSFEEKRDNCYVRIYR
jgi:7-cyano-7-deazaguanine synthase in queuosine biosynthesis